MEFLINPAWLFGYDVVFKLVFTMITGLVSYYSFRVYSFTGEEKTKLLGIAFSLFSVSYLVHALFSLSSFMYLENFKGLNILGVYFHMVFFLWGLATLVYMTLETDKPSFYISLVILLLAAFVFSGNSIFLAYILISIMLFYIFIHYMIGCIKKHKPHSPVIPIAFGLLFLGHIEFIFSISYHLFYAFGNLFELVAYVLILTKLVLVFTK